MIRNRVLESLRRSEGDFVSGGSLAAELSVSRTAVWKTIEQLRAVGFVIESVPNRGYRLVSGGDALSESGVSFYLHHTGLKLKVYRQISSTNTVLKQMAEEGAAEGTVLLAEEQSAGRGRMNRRFYSPPGTGLYVSLLLRPKMSATEATRITVTAAVAVAEAIEELTGRRTEIKWVNDILLDGKKVCGILTEGAIDVETGMLNYAVVGIGINVTAPEGGFPEEIREIAGAVCDKEVPGFRCRLAALLLDKFMTLYEQLPERDCYEAYKSRSSLLGLPINILTLGAEPIRATAVDIQPDFALLVRLEDGTIQALNSGEVSIRRA